MNMFYLFGEIIVIRFVPPTNFYKNIACMHNISFKFKFYTVHPNIFCRRDERGISLYENDTEFKLFIII